MIESAPTTPEPDEMEERPPQLSTAEVFQSPIERIPEAYEALGYPLYELYVSQFNEVVKDGMQMRHGGAFFQAGKCFRDFTNEKGRKKQFLFSDKTPAVIARDNAEEELYRKNPNMESRELDAMVPKLKDFCDEKVFLDIQERAETVGEKIVTGTIHDVVFGCPKEIAENLPTLPVERTVEKVGDCTSAEKFFFEFMNDEDSASRDFNLIVDDAGNPIALHKFDGEKSALLLTEVTMNNIRIPPGSLLAVDYKDEKKERNVVVPLSECKGFQFLRWSSFCLPPEERPTTTPYAYSEIQSAGKWYGVDENWHVDVAKKALERFSVLK
ncbi:MAG: hypothetical protein PHS53_00835 [Candidatus Pacebacteria bacterium]|nr:hypothetical protein [Candidatus Paceibacterota bacterium]MDD5356682.1 hypothetical protein [Candidatus Paceibacterota bacterium]